MNRAIRHTWIVSVAMFISLFAALSLIQVVFTDDLNNHPNNSRQVIQQAGAARGPITVGGSPIAESVESDGVYDYQRVYHEPYLYAGLTGFYSTEQGASSGIEQSMDEYLTGQSDAQFLDRMTSLFTGESAEGAQVELTIDPEWQQLAYDMIPDDARGHIIVTEVGTGDVKVMASKPSYDTNDLAVHSNEDFATNLADVTENVDPYGFGPINNTIAPGSTFKLVDTVAMLESGDYELDTELENPQELELPQSDLALRNFSAGNCHQQDEADFLWVFAMSCNTPFAQAALDLGQEPLVEVAERFGFNDPLAIPLHVSASQFPTDELSPPILAYHAIGQGSVTSTPLQMNMVASAIANGGTMMHPQLVDTVRGSDLQLLASPDPEVLNEVMDPDTASTLTEMMVETTESGTGWRAEQSGYEVATKTGTAEISDTDLVHSWITGFAPADDPQYAITVVYERIDLQTGSQYTGEQFSQMLQAVIEE